MGSKAKAILIDDLKEGMLLYNDVYTTGGILLKPKGAIIEAGDIDFFRNRKIDLVTVAVDQPKNNKVDKKAEKRKQVEAFSATHEIHAEALQNKIFEISNGKDIEVDTLNNITKKLLEETKSSSVLFNYLAQLRQSNSFIPTHSLNVSAIANIIATWAGLDKEIIENVTLAGLIHDIGYTDINDTIYHKEGPLSPEERKTVENHVMLGYQKLLDTNINPRVKQAVLLHHERTDGSGYLRYTGNKIPIESRIIAIADTYEAMTSDRLYRTKMTPFEAIKIFETTLKFKYDIELSYVFLNNIANQFIGSYVELSNKQEGVVSWVNPRNISKPLVEIEGSVVDLKEKNLKIVSIF